MKPDIGEIKRSVIKLTPKMHKGECGKILVIGGSEMYTGAPFFAAMSALRIGADLAHIVCEATAAPVIKGYSPDLIVYPYLVASNVGYEAASAAATHKLHIPYLSNKEPVCVSPLYEPLIVAVVNKVVALLPRMDVLVIGPGLGRDELMMECVARIVEEGKKREMLMVFDADGLFLVHSRPDLLKGYELAVLTPNVVEFSRLCKSVNLEVNDSKAKNDDMQKITAQSKGGTLLSSRLAAAFGCVTVIEKGQIDVITNAQGVLACDHPGGLKRSGGQGDLLSGCVAVWLLWAIRASNHKDTAGTQEEELRPEPERQDSSMPKMPKLPSGHPASLIAGYGACMLIREVSRVAYEQVGRGVQATDMLELLSPTFARLFET